MITLNSMMLILSVAAIVSLFVLTISNSGSKLFKFGVSFYLFVTLITALSSILMNVIVTTP